MDPQGVRPTVVRSPGVVSVTVPTRRVAVEALAALVDVIGTSWDT